MQRKNEKNKRNMTGKISLLRFLFKEKPKTKCKVKKFNKFSTNNKKYHTLELEKTVWVNVIG